MGNFCLPEDKLQAASFKVQASRLQLVTCSMQLIDFLHPEAIFLYLQLAACNLYLLFTE